MRTWMIVVALLMLVGCEAGVDPLRVRREEPMGAVPASPDRVHVSGPKAPRPADGEASRSCVAELDEVPTETIQAIGPTYVTYLSVDVGEAHCASGDFAYGGGCEESEDGGAVVPKGYTMPTGWACPPHELAIVLCYEPAAALP